MEAAAVVTANRYFILKEIATAIGSVEFLDPSVKQIRFRKKYNIPTRLLLGLPFGSTLSFDVSTRQWRVCDRLQAEKIVASIESGLAGGDNDCQDELSEDEQSEAKESEKSDTPPPKKARSAPENATLPDSMGPSQQSELLRDDNRAQKLRHADVVELKQGGLSDLELVSRIAEGSESFKKRTEFAREKYILRKLHRHVVQVAILRCDPSNIADVYGPPGKIGGVRPDHVHNMLNEGNVTENTSVLVFDHTAGFITMNILARLGGQGRCFFISDSRGVSDHIVKQANLSGEVVATKVDFALGSLLQAVANGEAARDLVQVPDGSRLRGVEADTAIPEADKERARQSNMRLVQKYEAKRKAWHDFLDHGLHAALFCVDANKVDANNPILLANLMSDLYSVAERFLQPGGRMAVHCSLMNPIADLFAYMKARRNTWAAVRLEEFMLRKICVLPGRSHPQMERSLRPFEGFLLTASRMAGRPEKASTSP